MCPTDAADGGSSYWSVVEPFWIPLNASWEDDPAKFLKAFTGVPKIAGNLYAAHWCQSEVFNGGFFQFFWNTTGILAPEVVVAFREIGLHEWEKVTVDAMQFFGESYPRERSRRLAVLLPIRGARPGPFDDFDSRFDSCAWLRGDIWRWDTIADEYAKNA